jgi:hypothetical protein
VNDKKLIEEYSRLKNDLVKEKGMTKEQYTRQKTNFIISVLKTLGLDKHDIIEITNANL